MYSLAEYGQSAINVLDQEYCVRTAGPRNGTRRRRQLIIRQALKAAAPADLDAARCPRGNMLLLSTVRTSAKTLLLDGHPLRRKVAAAEAACTRLSTSATTLTMTSGRNAARGCHLPGYPADSALMAMCCVPRMTIASVCVMSVCVYCILI